MRYFLILFFSCYFFLQCNPEKQPTEDPYKELKGKIRNNDLFSFVKQKSLDVVKTGFNAGDGYGEVWIRDYNTFIELSMEVFDDAEIQENLLVFFRMQGEDGNIIDGFIPKANVHEGGYDYIYSDLEPRYAGHKNTVETDQEASLIQAVYKYIQKSGNREFLSQEVGEVSLEDRLEMALDFLMQHRFDEEHGLIWGATTADWGDVQPEHDWGVYLTEDTHYAIDIYDNAMMLIAIDNFLELVPNKKSKWTPIREEIAKNVQTHLWDEGRRQFRPHVYLEESPFPEDFDEDQIYYHGGTAVAIEAGLLSREQIKTSIEKMIANVEASGAGSIGLTLYPPYPKGSFENRSMYPYGYQNGGDWTWFGGRMIRQLAEHGYIREAYEQLLPMTSRVVKNKGFFEWYTRENKPKGSGTFRGSAGVLYTAIVLLEEWAESKATGSQAAGDSL